MKRHIVSVHERKRPFVSDTWDARFATKNDLKGHISSVHDGKKYSNVPIVKFAIKTLRHIMKIRYGQNVMLPLHKKPT